MPVEREFDLVAWEEGRLGIRRVESGIADPDEIQRPSTQPEERAIERDVRS